MTMHLEGPWLSTSGKKKGKVKFRNAEEAKRARELDASWSALQKKYAAPTKKLPANVEAWKSDMSVTQRVTGPKLPSLNTGWVPCVKTPDKVYTGTKVKGIGTMHKSNAVPIFSDEEAVEISRMRR
jgi:hypothetical protein